ncbi:MAG TPA: DUF4124 domain-containing protein [Burkholderiales bacterium]|nr:DUF4124 domain-containing protein [Burkholderiales bacterium]
MARSKAFLRCISLALLAHCGHASAEVYKCPDASGRPTYTNVKRDTVGKKCTLVVKEVQVMPAQVPRPKSAGAVDRNQDRRKILESELQNEQQLLTDARQKLAEQESLRTGNERNYARVQERLKPYQDAIEQHTKNIEQLRDELGRLK